MHSNKRIIASALLFTFFTQTAALTADISPSSGTSQTQTVKKESMKQTHYKIKEFEPKNSDSYSPEAVQAFSTYIEKTLIDSEKILKEYNYGYKDCSSDKFVQKLPLKDGDYVIFNTKLQNNKKTLAAEYHKDGSLMGIVEMRTQKYSRKGFTAIRAFEYRLNDKAEFELKHVLFIRVDKDTSNPAKKNAYVVSKQYIFNADETLKCYLDGDTIYVSKKSDNLILNDLYVPGIEPDEISKGAAGLSQTMASLGMASMFTGVGLVLFPLILLHSRIDPEAYGSMGSYGSYN